MNNLFNCDLVSILMATNKVDRYLLPSINSMLNQSYTNIEIILVANGECAENVINYLNSNITDSRFFSFYTPIAQLSHALNLGLSFAKGQFVARMDCDDISVMDRIEIQLDFLKLNSLDLVGSNLELINEHSINIGERKYPSGKAINRCLPFSNTFAHNTVLARKDLLIKARGYNSGFNTEDYDMWLRLRRSGVKWDNIQSPLVKYRIHSGSTQRKLLGYAESTALSVREFILVKSPINLFAIFFQFIKSLFRSI